MQISKNALVRLMALYGQALCTSSFLFYNRFLAQTDIETGTAIPLEKGNTPFHGEVMLFKSRDCKDPVILGIGLTEHTLAVTEDECYDDTILLGLGTGSFQSFKFGNISPDIDPTAKKQPKEFGGYAYSNNCGNSRGSVKVTNHNGLSACTNVYSKDKVARSFMFYRL
jgi:hypothetical protein